MICFLLSLSCRKSSQERETREGDQHLELALNCTHLLARLRWSKKDAIDSSFLCVNFTVIEEWRSEANHTQLNNWEIWFGSSRSWKTSSFLIFDLGPFFSLVFITISSLSTFGGKTRIAQKNVYCVWKIFLNGFSKESERDAWNLAFVCFEVYFPLYYLSCKSKWTWEQERD